MKLHEVLNTIKDSTDYWFRPVSWKGCGQAYIVKDGVTILVPSARGGEASMTWDVEFLAGDWEITNAKTVLEESC